MNPVFFRHKGMAIPMVLGVLAVFAILILVLTQAGTSTYTQTALANHNLQTRMFAMATVEYATTLLHENIADPLGPRRWRKDVIKAVLSGGEYTIDFMEEAKIQKEVLSLILGSGGNIDKGRDPGGFQGGERVTDLELSQFKGESKYQLLEAKAKFHHFKPIKFDPLPDPGIYRDPTMYYRDPLGELPPLVPIGDLYGFVDIHVKVKFGRQERDLVVTRDVKVANNEPIGRNYAMFAVGYPSPTHSRSDLNAPGKFQIFAQQRGRIRIMGPYFLDTEGYPDGTGPENPVGTNYPAQTWDGYSFIPPPRGITVNGFLLSSGGIQRPADTSGTGTSIGIGSTGGLSLVPGSDPGLKARPEVQNYWSGTVELGEQNFSIAGSRESFDLWRGMLHEKGGSPFTPVGPFDGFESLQDDMEARIEGILVGNYYQQNFEKKHACMSLSTIVNGIMGIAGMFSGGGDASGAADAAGAASASSGGTSTSAMGKFGSAAMDLIQVCIHNYRVKKMGDKVPTYYGLHSPYEDEVDKFENFLGIVNDTMQSFQSAGASNEGGLIQALGTSVENMEKDLAQAQLQQNILDGGISVAGENFAAQFKNALPSNFKVFPRTAARKYNNFEEYFKLTQAGSDDGREIYLDGNVWIDELKLKKKIRYFGKGAIISAYTPTSNIYTAKPEAEIMGMEPARPGKDHMILFYRNSDNPEAGKGMLDLKGDFIGSLFSYQGVRPSGDITINGNLVVELINKSHFGDGNNLKVVYNPNYQEADKEEFEWFTVSFSPKISGIGQKLRSEAGGIGDDGVQVILETIGE